MSLIVPFFKKFEIDIIPLPSVHLLSVIMGWSQIHKYSVLDAAEYIFLVLSKALN